MRRRSFRLKPNAVPTLSGKSRPASNTPAVGAAAGGGLDQSTATGKRHRSSCVGHGRLISGSGVIFPDSHRGGEIRAEFAVLDGGSQMIGVGGWLLCASPVGISSRQA